MWGFGLNSRRPRQVRGPVVAWSWPVLAVALVGCVEISGGAAELSWSIRDSEGDSVRSCSAARIDQIRLCWQSVEDAGAATLTCPPARSDDFLCEDGTGVTGFEIPPGRSALFIIPICDPDEQGRRIPAVEDSYEVPPPIVRTVEDGRVVTLNSLLLVVNRTNCCAEPGQTGCDVCTCR